jgi:hypothetical protein
MIDLHLLSPITRRVLIWFAIGLSAPGVLWLLGQVAAALQFDAMRSWLVLAALGSWPFWLLLWFPAMSDPKSEVLFYLTAAAALVANGLLYALMAPVQERLRPLRAPFRAALLVLVYAGLIALGYMVCLAPDYLGNVLG